MMEEGARRATTNKEAKEHSVQLGLWLIFLGCLFIACLAFLHGDTVGYIAGCMGSGTSIGSLLGLIVLSTERDRG